MKRPPTTSTLFPYTTLFRSKSANQRAKDLHKLATETPHLLTDEHMKELPGLLATVPVSELKKMAAAFGGAAKGKLKEEDRKSTRLNSSHSQISYAVFCLKKK